MNGFQSFYIVFALPAYYLLLACNLLFGVLECCERHPQIKSNIIIIVIIWTDTTNDNNSNNRYNTVMNRTIEKQIK